MNRFNKILMIASSVALLMFACKDDNNADPDKKEKEPPYLKYEGSTDLWLPNVKGDTTVAIVDVNGAYYATVAEGGEWCTVSNIAVNSFVINYDENKIAEDRKTKITLSLEGVNDIEIVVSQRGPAPEVIIDGTFAEIEVSYAGAETVVPVKSNGVYTVEVEEGKDWCNVVNTGTEVRFNISPNVELESRNAKVTVSLTYRGSTASFEFIVSQLPAAILLVSPEEGVEINRASGFPYTFSWKRTGSVTDYSIAVSVNNQFPDSTTTVISVGNVDNYAITMSDIAKVMEFSSEIKAPLYWKVIPTDPSINMAADTRKFYVMRNYVGPHSYPLKFINPIGLPQDKIDRHYSWVINKETGEDWLVVQIGQAGQSSRRPFVRTDTLTYVPEVGSGQTLALAYEYKVTDKPAAYAHDVVDFYHTIDNWNDPVLGGEVMRRPFTDEWQTHQVAVPVSKLHVGATFIIMVRPPIIVASDFSMEGITLQIKGLRLEVFE
jgi:hypothetical protein